MTYTGIIAMALMGILLLSLPVAAFISLYKSTGDRNIRLIWLLIICFMPLVGSLLYFAVGPNRKANLTRT